MIRIDALWLCTQPQDMPRLMMMPHERQTNGFLEALNGLFQAAKRRARGFTNFDNTIKTVILLIAGKLDFASVNPHAG